MFGNLVHELSSQLIRIITGELFTRDQIKRITKHSIGRHFEGFFPDDPEEQDRAARLDAAQSHIASASEIISDMRIELDAQTESLERLIAEIEEKKSDAERYAALANTNKDAASAIKIEMEQTIANELMRQSNEGKRLRQFVSAIIWIVTLVLGAALGAYFKDIVALTGAS